MKKLVFLVLAALPVFPQAAPIIQSFVHYSQVVNGVDVPLAGAYLCSYQAGTLVGAETWADALEASPNTNPIVLDVNGNAQVFVDPSLSYKYVLYNGGTNACPSTGTVIFTQDNVQYPSAGGGGGGGGLTCGTGCTITGGVININIAPTTDLLAGDGHGNAVDSGIPGSGVTAKSYFSLGNNSDDDAGGGSFIEALGDTAASGNTGSQIVAIGNLAADANTASGVVAIGEDALKSNSGATSYAVGDFALETNSGIGSVGVGYEAGETNTGTYLTALGYQAAHGNTGADYVVALGYQAGDTNTGSYLVGIGYLAGTGNTGVQSVVAIGQGAAGTNTGDDVVAIGYYNGTGNSGNQLVALGSNNGISNTSDYLISIGDCSDCGHTTGDFDIFIGNGGSSRLTGSQKNINTSIVIGDFSNTVVNNSGGTALTNVIAIGGTATDSNQVIVGNPNSTAAYIGGITPAGSGVRYVCINTGGFLVSQAAACSGT